MRGIAIVEGAGHIAIAAMSTAAELAPLPYIQPAFDVFKIIVDLVHNVYFNRSSMKTLCRQCELLLKALEAKNGKYSPERLDEIVKEFVDTLNKIRERVQEWAQKTWLTQFVTQAEISEGVSDFLEEIKQLDMRLQIVANLELHNALGRNEETRKKDHDDIITHLNNLAISMELVCEIEAARKAGDKDKMQMSIQAMAISQDLLEKKEPDARDVGLRQTLFAMQEASGRLLPRTALAREVVCDELIKRRGAFIVYKGRYLDKVDCAIKLLSDIDITEKRLNRFIREINIWRGLYELDQGRFIVPLLGYITEGKKLFMVSPWMENGTAISYVTKNPAVDRKKMIRQIAEGISFLHSRQIIHSDIKGENIYVKDDGEPVLADFGMAKKVEEEDGAAFTQSQDLSESFRWFAPEIFDEGRISTASDVYSYAMTVLELMTEQVPFAGTKTVLVVQAVENGKRPDRPGVEATARGLDDNLWNLLQWCWRSEPHARPRIGEVLEQLQSK